jgi:hypothetical protein
VGPCSFSSQAEIVRVIDAPTGSSDRNLVSIVPSSASNEARVRMGALAHGQYASFHLLLLNANQPRQGDLGVATTLPGIPGPFKTSQSPQERLSNRVAPFAIVAFLVVMGWAAVKEMRQLHLLKSPKALLKYSGLILVASIMFAGFVSPVLAWMLWRFL